MPSIKEKLKAEVGNERTIRLWPEGTFYKAYERSAYLFVKQVRPYQVRKRYVDVVAQNVVSVGFPQSVLKSLGVNSHSERDGSVTFGVDTPLDEQQYLQWYDDIQPTDKVRVQPSAPEKGAVVDENITGSTSFILRRLREFNLANATPTQCLLLVSELQNML